MLRHKTLRPDSLKKHQRKQHPIIERGHNDENDNDNEEEEEEDQEEEDQEDSGSGDSEDEDGRDDEVAVVTDLYAQMRQLRRSLPQSPFAFTQSQAGSLWRRLKRAESEQNSQRVMEAKVAAPNEMVDVGTNVS